MRIIAATILIFLGLTFRWLAIRQLGENWSFNLEKPKGIITTGIYRLMRHPSYFGSLLIIFGLNMIDYSLGIMAISFAFFLERITDEEQILDCPNYKEYKKRVGIFWPKWRLKKWMEYR